MEFLKRLEVHQKFLLIFFSILFIYLFIQNFVFSNSFEYTQLRHLDDCAFNITLNRWHHHLMRLKLSGILNENGYGYGWIFWALYGVITFPFYLLNQVINAEPLIISTLRNISLIFSFGSIYLIYKILGFYTKNNFYKTLITVLASISPFFLCYSMCFDTTAMIRFFSILSVYLILKDETLSKKTIVLSALSLAIAFSAKLTGLFVAPLVGFLVLDRMKYKFNKENLKKLGLFSIVFILGSIFFTNPGLLLFFCYKNEVKHYFEIMAYQIANSKTPSAGTLVDLDYYKLLVSGIGFHYGLYAFYTFILLFVVKIIQDIKKKTYDFIYILITLLVFAIYLVFTIKQGGFYIAKYFSVLCVFLPFSILAFEPFKKKGYAAAALLFAIIFYTTNIKEKTPPYYEKQINTFANLFYIKKDVEKEKPILLRELKNVIPYDENKKIKIMHDYRIPAPHLSLRKNIRVASTFDNLSTMDWFIDPDYLIIYKKGIAFLSENEIKEKFGKPEIVLEDKKIIKELMNKGTFRDDKYELIYDKYDALVYKKVGEN